jgi:hypothetical protein
VKSRYEDIRKKIKEDPQWWDEHGAPRYCPFSPDSLSNIYAEEAVLLEIKCQGCDRKFEVGMSYGFCDKMEGTRTLSERVKARSIHYGDPPNVACCSAGSTMNSDPIRVLQFWQRKGGLEWKRIKRLEKKV